MGKRELMVGSFYTAVGVVFIPPITALVIFLLRKDLSDLVSRRIKKRLNLTCV